jgi:LytR cell envelope-related transcriptional attenuator
MSMRENPIRRRPSARPPWLLPALVVGGVAVAAALVVIIVRLVGTSDDAADAATAAPEPACSTVMAAPADELPLPQKVRVNVYNATETSGLASKTARELTRRGFEVKEVANDPVGLPIEGVARIRYGPGSTERAELLAYYVPGAELVEIERKGPKIDLALGDQFTGIAPQTDVDAALNTPEAVLTGPGCFGQTAATIDAGTLPAMPVDSNPADTTGVTPE